MTHSKQSAKRVRQNEKRRVRNKSKLSSVRTLMKKIIHAGDTGDVETAKAMLPATLARIDKAAKASVLHKNTAARRKSRAMRQAAKAEAVKGTSQG